MRLQLKKVRWMNFLSYGNYFTELDLDSHTKTLICGINGHGKSAFLDIVSFGLFNKPFRNIGKPLLTNSITRKNCLVEIEFSIGGYNWIVRRGQNPSVFEIYKNDELLNQTADVRDYQRALEENILRMNHKTFCQVVMLGSAIFRPFMTLPAADRRNVIEDLLDQKIFSVMNTILKKRMTDNEKLLDEKKKARTLLDERIRLTEKHIKELQVNNDKLITDKTAQLDKTKIEIQLLKNNIEFYTQTIATLSEGMGDLTKLQKSLRQFNDLDYKLEAKKERLQKDIEFFEENETCPTCTQVIDTEFKANIVAASNDELSAAKDTGQKLSEKISELQAQIMEIGKIQQDISENNTRIREHRKAIEYHEGTIRNIEREIATLSKTRDEIDSSHLLEWKQDQGAVTEEITALNETHYTMELTANLLKDTGIKAKMIKSYIPVLNSFIQKYLAILDFYVEFTLDEQFKETIKSRYRDEFSYESFSQGEKARIDLALLFAFRAIAKARGSVDINLVVFDEVLDTSLDSDGIDSVFKLLGSLEGDENVFVISHREGISEDKFDRVLRVKKVKNFSRMVAA